MHEALASNHNGLPYHYSNFFFARLHPLSSRCWLPTNHSIVCNALFCFVIESVPLSMKQPTD